MLYNSDLAQTVPGSRQLGPRTPLGAVSIHVAREPAHWSSGPLLGCLSSVVTATVSDAAVVTVTVSDAAVVTVTVSDAAAAVTAAVSDVTADCRSGGLPVRPSCGVASLWNRQRLVSADRPPAVME